MPPTDKLVELPDDSEALKAIVRSLLLEHDAEKHRADDLHIENLRLQVELDRYKKWYYGPRADRLQTTGDLAQMLLGFAEALDQKPVDPGDVPPHTEPDEELRRVRRRKGRRHLANFENLPVTTHVYELSEEQLPCPCCGVERKEIGQEESWQIEHIPGRFERIHHVRKKYACPGVRDEWRQPTHRDRGQAGDGDRQGAGRAGAAGLHRHQQVRRVRFHSTVGRHLRSGRDLKSRGPRSRSGAATWAIWSSHSMN